MSRILRNLAFATECPSQRGALPRRILPSVTALGVPVAHRTPTRPNPGPLPARGCGARRARAGRHGPPPATCVAGASARRLPAPEVLPLECQRESRSGS